MSSVKVKINKKDLARLNHLFKKARTKAPQVLSDEIGKAAMFIVADAAEYAPVYKGPKYLGGNLRQSIGHEAIGKNAKIFAKAKYAPYQEFGTGRHVDVKEAAMLGIPPAEIKRLYKGQGKRKVNIQPQPFFFPAVRKGLKRLMKSLERRIGRLV